MVPTYCCPLAHLGFKTLDELVVAMLLCSQSMESCTRLPNSDKDPSLLTLNISGLLLQHQFFPDKLKNNLSKHIYTPGAILS